jgi:hypothetical protein
VCDWRREEKGRYGWSVWVTHPLEGCEETVVPGEGLPPHRAVAGDRSGAPPRRGCGSAIG